MQNITLDGNRMTSERTAHGYLADMLDIPDYYGKDLDSIYDALTDIVEDTILYIYGRHAMHTTSYGSRLIWVMDDAASDNEHLKIVWDEE